MQANVPLQMTPFEAANHINKGGFLWPDRTKFYRHFNAENFFQSLINGGELLPFIFHHANNSQCNPSEAVKKAAALIKYAEKQNLGYQSPINQYIFAIIDGVGRLKTLYQGLFGQYPDNSMLYVELLERQNGRIKVKRFTPEGLASHKDIYEDSAWIPLKDIISIDASADDLMEDGVMSKLKPLKIRSATQLHQAKVTCIQVLRAMKMKKSIKYSIDTVLMA